MTASPLVTITGDGTFLPPGAATAGTGAANGARGTDGARAAGGPGRPGAGRADTAPADAGIDDPALAALTRLRGLLGDDLEDQIATRLYLPAACGTEPADQLLPASLTLLADTSGDLTSYGWRVGTGAGRAWTRARELRERMADAARIGLFGYEGPLVVTTLGPVSLAAATFVASGERTLADCGAVRDLPVLLGEGVATQVRALRERVPGVDLRVLLREDHVRAVHEGRVPTPSGYRRYPAVAAPEIGPLWSSFLGTLREEVGTIPVTTALPPTTDLLAAVRTAGTDAVAVAPRRMGSLSDARGRTRWEALAGFREAGTGLELIVDPEHVDRELGGFAANWHQLGYGPRDLAGLTLLAHRMSGDRPADAAAQPSTSSLLTDADLTRVLRAAPAWAERTQD
jgi:hypothetical protein